MSTELSRRSFCTGVAAAALAPVVGWRHCEPDWYIGQDWRELNRVAFRRPTGTYSEWAWCRDCSLATNCLNREWFCGAAPETLQFLGADWDRGEEFDTMRVHFTPVEGRGKIVYFAGSTHHGPTFLREEPLYGVAEFAPIFSGWEMVGYLERE